MPFESPKQGKPSMKRKPTQDTEIMNISTSKRGLISKLANEVYNIKQVSNLIIIYIMNYIKY